MITLFILLVLTVLGIYLLKDYTYDPLGPTMTLIFGIWLLIHSFCLLTVSYDYKVFVQERNAFEQTLKNSRETGNEYETAAIVKDVADWNTRLAQKQYDNTTLWFDQFIDDRFDDLKPIK